MQLKKFHIKKLSKELIPAALNICDLYLGKGLYTEDSLCRILSLPHTYFYVIFDEDLPIAVFYCHACTTEQIKKLYPYIDVAFCDPNKLIGIFRSIAITEKYRNIDLAENLNNYFADFLFKNENVSQIFVLAWMKKNYIPASNHLERCGFSQLKIVKHPWYEERNLRCHVCGEKHCICDGVLYTKISGELNNGKKNS